MPMPTLTGFSSVWAFDPRIAKEAVLFLRRLHYRLCQAATPLSNWACMLRQLTSNALSEPRLRLVAG